MEHHRMPACFKLTRQRVNVAGLETALQKESYASVPNDIPYVVDAW